MPTSTSGKPTPSQRRNDIEEALGVYDLAVGVYPDCTEAWTGKGNVLRLQGKRREALECAERAMEIGLSPVAETLRDILVDELRREGAIR